MISFGDSIVPLTKVSQMHGGVQEAVEDYQPSGDLVEEDVLVEGQEQGQAQLAELRDGGSQHHHQDEHRSEVEALTWAPVVELALG